MQICSAPSNPVPQSHPQLCRTPATASLLPHLLPISSGSHRSSPPSLLPTTNCSILTYSQVQQALAGSPQAIVTREVNSLTTDFSPLSATPSAIPQSHPQLCSSPFAVTSSRSLPHSQKTKRTQVEHITIFPLVDPYNPSSQPTPLQSVGSQYQETRLTWNPQRLQLTGSQKNFLPGNT